MMANETLIDNQQTVVDANVVKPAETPASDLIPPPEKSYMDGVKANRINGKFARGHVQPAALKAKPGGGHPGRDVVAIRRELEAKFAARMKKVQVKILDRYFDRALQNDRVMLDARKVMIAEARSDGVAPGSGMTAVIMNYGGNVIVNAPV